MFNFIFNVMFKSLIYELCGNGLVVCKEFDDCVHIYSALDTCFIPYFIFSNLCHFVENHPQFSFYLSYDSVNKKPYIAVYFRALYKE